MTDDLQTKFAVLTDARPEPSDPAAPIRLRIKRRQRRRRGTVAVLVTAAAVAVALAGGPALNALRSSPTGPTGFAGPPTAPATGTAAPQIKVLPPPYSDKKFTKMPDANAYRPAAYYVAQGKIPQTAWAMLSTEGSCLVADEDGSSSFGDPFICFDDWAPGQVENHYVAQGHTQEKSTTKINHTLVLGAVSIEARKVRIIAGGKTYLTDAVGTPTTDLIRFFTIEIPQRDLKITSITPLDAAGNPAPAPKTPPASICTVEATNCQTLPSSTPVK